MLGRLHLGPVSLDVHIFTHILCFFLSEKPYKWFITDFGNTKMHWWNKNGKEKIKLASSNP